MFLRNKFSFGGEANTAFILRRAWQLTRNAQLENMCQLINMEMVLSLKILEE